MSETEPVVEPIEEPDVVLEAPATVSMEQVEEAAREQGWSPDKGDLNALEFLAEGRKFRDRLTDQIKELKSENEKVYGMVAERFKREDVKDHAEQVQAIEAQIDEAISEGDVEKVRELRAKIPTAPVAPTNVPDPNIQFIETWKTQNKWFDENADMRDDALGFYQTEKLKLGEDNPSAILPKVQERIKKFYPEKFNLPDNPNAKRGADVATDGKKSQNKKGGLSRNDLTEDESAHFDQWIKMGMKEDKLLASIAKLRK